MSFVRLIRYAEIYVHVLVSECLILTDRCFFCLLDYLVELRCVVLTEQYKLQIGQISIRYIFNYGDLFIFHDFHNFT